MKSVGVNGMGQVANSRSVEELKTRGSRLIIANTINDMTYREVTPESISLIDLFAFQELWLIEPGDVIVTARPMSEEFVAMVCQALSLERSSFTCLSPNIAPEAPLVPALLRSGLLAEFNGRSNMRIRACALDQPLLDLSLSLGLLIEDYTAHPGPGVLAFVDNLNTKSGFRKLAISLGLPVADGFEFLSATDVEEAVEAILDVHHEAIVKCDRGSGGAGQFRMNRLLLHNVSTRRDELMAFIRRNSDKNQTFAVEACLPLQLDPTVDVYISESGPRCLYIGSMDCSDGAFSGMSVPSRGLPELRSEELQHAAASVGQVLQANGYRGFFDIDAGLTTSGKLILFESNVRRTSTSLWEAVLSRFTKRNSNDATQWTMHTYTCPAVWDQSLSTVAGEPPFASLHSSAKLAAWASSERASSFLYLESALYRRFTFTDQPISYDFIRAHCQ